VSRPRRGGVVVLPDRAFGEGWDAGEEAAPRRRRMEGAGKKTVEHCEETRGRK